MPNEIVLTQARAVRACNLLLSGIKGDIGIDVEGMVTLSGAVALLRTAFETVQESTWDGEANSQGPH